MRHVTALVLTLAVTASATAQDRPLPYWASIAAGEAMMRTGPDRGFPAIWAYHRRDLPLRVVQMQGAWRRVTDQDGATGWMLATLLAARRTAVVTGLLRPIREAPNASARLLWQAEPGVVGRISHCDGAWCRIQIGEKQGYIEQSGLWGVDTSERVA